MNGEADCFGLISQGAANRLLDPPGSVGAEFGATIRIKTLHPLHQADISFADEVEQRQSQSGIVVGNFHNEAEVGSNHLFTGCPIPPLDPLS